MESHTRWNAIILKEHVKHQVFQNVQVCLWTSESKRVSCCTQMFHELNQPVFYICLTTEQVEVQILVVRWRFFFILTSRGHHFDIFPVFRFYKWQSCGEEIFAIFQLADASSKAAFFWAAFNCNMDESLCLEGDNQEITLSVFYFFCLRETPAIDHNSILCVAPFQDFSQPVKELAFLFFSSQRYIVFF
jgi:hypothetical protein